MFYLKDGKKKLLIEDDNTFVQCQRCGKELQISLADAVIDGELDIYGIAWYCDKCGEKIHSEQ